MFESTVLKMSNRERQQALAQQEETYDKRRRALKEREENLQYRQQLAKENPQAALDAMNVDAQSREAAREQAALAAKVKKQFGVDGHEIIDTPEVRSALEQALAEHTEKQRDREKQLEERANLLKGLQELALVDATRVKEILDDYRERHPQRELTHDQLTEKFRQAISKNDDKGVFKNYAKSLDGWAQSLEDRNRELDALERRLDMQEKMLRKEIDQTLARQAREAELAKGAAEAIERGKENNAVETGKTVDVALEAGKSTEPKAVQATPADGRAADATPVSVEAKAPSIEGQATAAKSDAGRAAPTEAKTVSVEPPVREQPAASAPSIAGNAQYRGDPRLEREAERMSNLLGVPMAEARQTVMDLVSNYEERGAEWARERFWKEREGLHREIQTAEREAASASLGKDVPGELLALLQQEISRGEQHRAREAERGAAPAGLETPAVDGKQTDEPTHAKTSDSPADGAQRSAETPTIEQKEAALDGKSTQTEVAGKEASTLAQGVLELTTGEGAAELSKAAREVSAALDASARSTEQQQAKATPANGTGKEAANQSAERAPAAAAPADGAGKEAASQSSPERSPSRQSPGGHFSKLSKAEQRERREAFSGQLNQLAGFSRDGTQIVSEKLRAEMSARGDRGYGRGD